MNYGKRKLSSRADSVTRAESPPGNAGEAQDNAKRRVRNMTEKKRRDQFSQLIGELANIVCAGTKKPDKTNVLQMTIEFLKRQKASQSAMDGESTTDDGWKPPFMSDDELLALLMEAGGSFVVVFSKEGTILFVSGGASSVLGLPLEVLLGKHIYELFHPSDHGFIEDLLHSPDDNRLTVLSGESLPPPARVHIVSVKGSGIDSRLVTYERAELLAMDVVPRGIIPRPPTGDTELSEDVSEAADDYSIFIQLVGHRRSKEFFGTPALHFGTRHSSTFKITHVDESASNVIGFQPSEMLGTPGYLYYHEDDLERIAAEHKTLIKAGCCTTAYYRHLTKSNDWVWIRSHYYVTYEMWTGRALVVHGTHYLARPEDVRNDTPYNDLIQMGSAMKSGLSVLNKPAASPTAATPRTKLLSEDDDSSNTTGLFSASPAPPPPPTMLLPGSGASTFGASAVGPYATTPSGMQPGTSSSSSSLAAAVAAAVAGYSGMASSSSSRPSLGRSPGDALAAASCVQVSKASQGVTDETTGPARLPLYAYSRIEKAFMKQSIELMKNQRQISEVGDDVEAIMEAASAKVTDLPPSSLVPSAGPSSSSSSQALATVPSPQSVMSLSPSSCAGGSLSSAAALIASLPGRRVQLSAVQQRLHEQLLKKYHELQALMELQQQELREVYQHLLLAAPLCAASPADGDEMGPDSNKP